MNTINMIAQIATSIGVIVAILVFAYELRQNRKSNEYENFILMLSKYSDLAAEGISIWGKIKKILLKNPKTAQEVHDKQNTINYLLGRVKQKEALYAIEYELIQNEIQLLNFLNQLSYIALHNKQARTMLCLTLANEITFFKNNINKIMQIHKVAKEKGRLFSPKSNFLLKIDTSDWFDQKITK